MTAKDTKEQWPTQSALLISKDPDPTEADRLRAVLETQPPAPATPCTLTGQQTVVLN